MVVRHPSHLPRDKFMDEVVEDAPLKENKKKRPRKKKQIAQSLRVVSRGRFRHKESTRMRKQMRKQICMMKRLNQWPPIEAELGVVRNGSTAAIMHDRFRQVYDDEVRANRKYNSMASTRRTAMLAALPAIPASAPFPFPYTDTFESYTDESTVKYLTDHGGSFNAAPAPAMEGEAATSAGMALHQVVDIWPIEWLAAGTSPAAGRRATPASKKILSPRASC